MQYMIHKIQILKLYLCSAHNTAEISPTEDKDPPCEVAIKLNSLQPL